MDYKESLLLPKTDFPMRGNLPGNEPIKYKQWDEKKVYEKMKQNRVGCESFTLHDGPPYANGNIHIGHALNKILKDIINKFHYFEGKSIRYVPGWDCHGLPISKKLRKKLVLKRKNYFPNQNLDNFVVIMLLNLLIFKELNSNNLELLLIGKIHI